MAHIARRFDAPKAALFTAPIAPLHDGLAILHGLDDAQRQLAARYGREVQDPWILAGTSKGLLTEGAAVLDTDLLPREAFLRTVAYRDYMRHNEIAKLCTGIVFDGRSPHLPTTFCSLYRDLGDPDFTDDDRRTMALVVPHLSRSLGVMFRLRDAELKTAATLDALDRLPIGIILVAADGTVSHTNRVASEVLERGDGIGLTAGRANGAGARLTARDAKVQAELARALAAAMSTGRVDVPHFSATVAVPRTSGTPLVLQFAPLPRGNRLAGMQDAASGIVFVIDPERDIAVDQEMLRRLYGVTPAEGRLAALLARGHTPHDAAALLEVSRDTVKVHLGRLFTKTGTTRQAELLRLLAGLSAGKA